MEFRGYQSTYVASLPPVDQTPLFQEHDSLYRLLLKACAPDPADRFVSADELRVQLLGVLREVVGRSGARARPSTRRRPCSSTSPRSPTTPSTGRTCPRLRTDDSDPQMPWLRTVSIDDPVQRLAALEGAPRDQPGGAARQGPRRAGGRASSTGSTSAVADAARRRPVGVAGRLDVGAGRPRPAADGRGAERVQRGLRAGARRAGAQAGPGVRLRDRRRHRRRRVALRDLRPHRRQLHRAGRVRPRPDPLRPGRRRGRGPRAGPRPGDQPGVHPGATQPGRPARRVGRRAAVAGRRPGQHREPHHRPRRPVPLPRRGAQCGARPRGVARRGHHGRHRRAARGRAVPARRARGGVPRPGRATPRAARSGSHLVDQANAVRRWTLR